jgi:ATP adenylyltransferase
VDLTRFRGHPEWRENALPSNATGSVNGRALRGLELAGAMLPNEVASPGRMRPSLNSRSADGSYAATRASTVSRSDSSPVLAGRGDAVHAVTRQPASECRLCAIRSSDASWDHVLLESPHFLVVPSKGAFLPGWVMLVPKVHVLSVAQLDGVQTLEFNELLAEVRALVARRFSAPTCFEHGATYAGTSFGCGIDHAHTHLVPLPKDMSLRAVAEAALGVRFSQSPASPQRPYLRILEPDSDTWLTLEPVSNPPRQFFRQALWRAAAQPSESYDYDLSPCEDKVRSTVTSLTS